MKVLMGAVAAAVIAMIAAVAYSGLMDDEQPRHRTQRELRTALPGLATAELRARGHVLNGPLTCRDMPGWSKGKLRVRCSGTTAARLPVDVIGAAEDTEKQEFFTILVDGRPVVQNVPCLAGDCRTGD